METPGDQVQRWKQDVQPDWTVAACCQDKEEMEAAEHTIKVDLVFTHHCSSLYNHLFPPTLNFRYFLIDFCFSTSCE